MDTSRELVYKALEYGTPGRIPRQTWLLKWAQIHHKEAFDAVRADFPDDIVLAPARYAIPPRAYGKMSATGTFIDEWGCVYTNIQAGVQGEVKEALVKDLDDLSPMHVPEELLSLDIDFVNDFCESTDKFVITAPIGRPFERLQFIRTTENAYVDLAMGEPGIYKLLDAIHSFYKKEIDLWCTTKIDGLWFMDDWGSQQNLLVSPKIWREIFKPMYKDYVDIIHSHGKKAFFHSDGYTLDIVPDMIEIGTDAINLQIFCIGIDKLKKYKGRITFWGEIDRQHLLPEGSEQDIIDAVMEVKNALYDPHGGIIAECEFGAGAKPENVRTVFKTWDTIKP